MRPHAVPSEFTIAFEMPRDTMPGVQRQRDSSMFPSSDDAMKAPERMSKVCCTPTLADPPTSGWMGSRWLTPFRCHRLAVLLWAMTAMPVCATTPQTREITLVATHLAVEEDGDRVWATVSGADARHPAALVAIDPVTAAVERSFPLGAEPARVLLPAGQSFAWVVLNDAAGSVVARVHLESGAVDPGWRISDTDTEPLFVEDILASSSDPELVVVARRTGVNNGHAGVAAYKNGVKLPRQTAADDGIRVIETSPDDGIVWGLGAAGTPGVESFLYHLSIGPEGVEVARKIPKGPDRADPGCARIGSRLYFSTGEVLDGATGACVGWLGSVGTSVSTLIVGDEKRGRVYFASNQSVTTTLRTLDTSIFVERGAMPLTIRPFPLSGARWGERGLVFRNSNGLLFMETGLVPVGAPVDLELAVETSAATVSSGQSATCRFTIKNNTDRLVTNTRLGVSWTAGTMWGRIQPPNLPLVLESTRATVSLGSLEPGATQEITIEFSFPSHGVRSIQGTAWCDGIDRDPANDARTIHTMVGINPGILEGGGYRNFPFLPEDAQWCQESGRLYVIVATLSSLTPPSELIELDPEKGEVKRRLPLGAQADQIELSQDGRYLYIGLAGVNRIYRVDTRAWCVDLQFNLVGPPSSSRVSPLDFAIAPDNSDVLLVTRDSVDSISSAGVSATVYERGIPRPLQLTGVKVPNRVEASDRPGVFWGFSPARREVFRLAVNAEGVRVEDSRSGIPGRGSNMHAAGDLIVVNSGEVINGSTLEIRGHLDPASSPDNVIALDSPNRKIYLRQEAVLRAFDLDSLALLGEANISGVPRTIYWLSHPMVRLGVDGLAMMRDNSSSFYGLSLLRHALVSSSAGADVRTSLSATTDTPLVGQEFEYHLTARNEGASPLLGVSLQITVPNLVTIVSPSVSGAACAVSRTQVRCTVGDLAPGEEKQMVVRVRPLRAGTITATAAVLVNLSPVIGEGSQASLTRAVGLQLGRDDTGAVDVAARDMTYVPRLGQFFLTVAGPAGSTHDSVLGLNPQTGLLDAPMAVGRGANRLEVSDDGRHLYVGIDESGKIQRIDLDTRTIGLEFDLGHGTTRVLAARDLVVLPGQADTLVVARAELGATWPAALAVYDQGVKRSTEGPLLDRIEPSAFPNHILAYHQAGPDHGVYRLHLASEEIVASPASYPLRVAGPDADILSVGGRLYGRYGEVIDGETLSVAGQFDVTDGTGRFGTTISPDPATGRAYAVEDGLLKVFDLTTSRPLAQGRLSGEFGLGRRLFRWGADGLASATSSRVYLMRNPLIPSGPATDLSVSVIPSLVEGETDAVHYRIIGRNHGTNEAPGARLSLTLPAGAAVRADSSDAPGLAAADGVVWIAIGDLAAGSEVERSVKVKLPPRGVFHALAAISAAVLDARPTNDSAVAVWATGFPLRADELAPFSFPARSVAWEPNSARLLMVVRADLTFPRDALVIFNPLAGTMEHLVELGREPGLLAVSDDGQFAYVSRHAPGAVQRVKLASGLVDLEFLLNGRIAEDMLVLPGQPGVLVISEGAFLTSPSHQGVRVYDSGAARPAITPGHTGPGRIEPSPSPGLVWGYDAQVTGGFYHLRLSAEGATITLNQPGGIMGPGLDIRSAGGRLYSTSGWVIDPDNGAALGQFSFPQAAPIAPDARLGKTLAFHHAGLISYDNATFEPLGVQTLPEIPRPVHRLERWGDDGVAMLVWNGQLWLGRTALLTKPGVLDLDEDGLPDVWEVARSLDPALAADALFDHDLDGASTLHEFRAGTDPFDFSSVFRVTRFETMNAPEGGVTLKIEFNAVENRIYNIEVMENLDAGWAPIHLRTVTATLSGPREVEIPVPPGAEARYLRVRLVR